MPGTSSRHGLTFPDAVRLLGGPDDLLPAPDDTFSLRSVRGALVEWGGAAVRQFAGGADGTRYERTLRVAAIHGVVVVTAFFEALDDRMIDRPIVSAGFLRVLRERDEPLPSPAGPQTLRTDLEDYYRSLARCVDAEERDQDRLVGAANNRYRIGFRALAGGVPDFALWAADPIADQTTGLVGVRALLERLTGGFAARRSDLATRYRRELDRPIVEVDALPDGVALPTTAELYVNPRARLRQAGSSAPAATESWWADAVAVDDIQPFLARYLTGLEAVATPLLVLGQPGSGKSVLSRVLAANLPAADFLPVRVELRSVAADAPLQDQIEEGVYQAIGERVAWPELVRSAGGALPVVMLDGFDELLQASTVNRANYLEQVRDFQRREADLGRPVAVLVTSRIVVADRARVPEGSMILRLDPFDEARIRCWLAVWDTTNRTGLAEAGLVPLTADVALRYPELAEQPLLLLMLALYDAWENALRQAPAGLDRAELYERLFTDFALREVAKLDSGTAAIPYEIRRLELVAMAMCARGTQVVTEEELDSDLRQLLRDERAQTVVGRFFFIHESRAREGVDLPERSFEFLHATFGEFLVARLVVHTVADLAAERAHQMRRPYPAAVDAGPLYAWLSFAVLTGSAPVVDFCRSLLARQAPDVRAECRALLVELLRDPMVPHSTWSAAGYAPISVPGPARAAAFSANILVLIMLLSPDGVDVAELFPAAAGSWRSHALLWESQLPVDGWRSLWQSIRMTHRPFYESNRGRTRHWAEARLTAENDTPVGLCESLPWPVETPSEMDSPFRDVRLPPASTVGSWLREAAFRHDGGTSAAFAYSLAPLWRYAEGGNFEVIDAYPMGTGVSALLEVILAPRGVEIDSERLCDVYQLCLNDFGGVDTVQDVLFHTIEDDAQRIDPDAAMAVLTTMIATFELHDPAMESLEPARIARILATIARRSGDPAMVRASVGRWPYGVVQSCLEAVCLELRRLGIEQPELIWPVV